MSTDDTRSAVKLESPTDSTDAPAAEDRRYVVSLDSRVVPDSLSLAERVAHIDGLTLISSRSAHRIVAHLTPAALEALHRTTQFTVREDTKQQLIR